MTFDTSLFILECDAATIDFDGSILSYDLNVLTSTGNLGWVRVYLDELEPDSL